MSAGLRDYIHIVDLAEGHVKALDRLIGTSSGKEPSELRFKVINLGSGVEQSVLDLVKGMQKASRCVFVYSLLKAALGTDCVSSILASLTKSTLLSGGRAMWSDYLPIQTKQNGSLDSGPLARSRRW